LSCVPHSSRCANRHRAKATNSSRAARHVVTISSVQRTFRGLLFNPIDPSPPRERDLDSKAEEFIAERSASAQRRLSQLFRDGRTSLLIGLLFLTAAFILAGVVVRRLGQTPVSSRFRERMIIGGWVAMWRPLEIFLYDWWPIRAERRLYDRLSVMPARVTVTAANSNASASREYR
jgi:hypothetical protein